jgi:ferredoxin
VTLSKPDASVLYHTFVEADRLRTQMLKDGATREAANDIVAKALEQAWPKGRNEPWRYLCESCQDSGWRVFRCRGDASCGRVRVHLEHEYVQLCWCAKGQDMKPKSRGTDDELASVGKTQKPSRFGR